MLGFGGVVGYEGYRGSAELEVCRRFADVSVKTWEMPKCISYKLAPSSCNFHALAEPQESGFGGGG